MKKRLLKYYDKIGKHHVMILFFIISLKFVSHSNVIAGLIVWLTLTSISLGLLNTDKIIKTLQ